MRSPSSVVASPKACAPAFDIGREYGHREDVLERLEREIQLVSDELARGAWGPQRSH